jgi:SAM-dependent methyltransferase
VKRYRAIAEYYDAEHERMEMLRKDVPFFLRHIGKRRQSVLELATGTARAAIPIAQAGHQVVGVDYAADMLAIARRKRDAVGLSDRELRLVQADVLKLKLERKFDWICIFFNTLLGFTTLAATGQVSARRPRSSQADRAAVGRHFSAALRDALGERIARHRPGGVLRAATSTAPSTSSPTSAAT